MLELEGFREKVDIRLRAALDALAFLLLVLGLSLYIEAQLAFELPDRGLQVGVLMRIWLLKDARGVWRARR